MDDRRSLISLASRFLGRVQDKLAICSFRLQPFLFLTCLKFITISVSRMEVKQAEVFFSCTVYNCDDSAIVLRRLSVTV